MTVRDRVCRSAVRTTAALTSSACDDVKLIPLRDKRTAVTLQLFPRALIIKRSLRHHVGHEKGRRIVRDRSSPVGRRRMVSAIESRARVIRILHLVPTGRQTRVGPEVVLTRSVAEPRAIEMPGDPVRNSAVAMIRHYILTLKQEIVRGITDIRRRV